MITTRAWRSAKCPAWTLKPATPRTYATVGDRERHSPERTLGEAVEEAGHDEQRGRAQKPGASRRMARRCSARLGGQREKDRLQEEHHEVGQAEQHPVLTEGVGDGKRGYEHGRRRGEDHQPRGNTSSAGTALVSLVHRPR